MKGPDDEVDYEGLADELKAISSAVRLELLDRLAAPAALSEIRVAPRRGAGGESPARAAAMTTVAEHLRHLVDTGLVVTEERESGGKRLTTYVVSPQRLYAITEELRLVASHHGGRGRGVAQTGTLAGGAGREAPQGARLLLVHGAYEGRSFLLEGAGPWIVGRRRDATVALDYDPFVSLENSRIERVAERFEIVDLPENKNGTSIHWRPVPRGGRAPLRHGDVLGVGRSLLVFYES